MKKITVKTEKEVLRKSIPYGDEVIVINELSEKQKLELTNVYKYKGTERTKAKIKAR